MSPLQLAACTALTMLAFAANSLLCRLALKDTAIDAASFAALRILSGALMLWLLMRWRGTASGRKTGGENQGSWRGALALFVYVVAFSFAYLSLAAGTGALILFGAVQITMILAGFMAGERMNGVQKMGFVAAMAGLVVLVLPGVETPSVPDALLMLASGVSWGMYSLFGRGLSDPAAATSGNFLRAAALAIALSLLALPWLNWDATGALYAVLSGGLASGLGYALWYRVLQQMSALTASTIQLCSPLLVAAGGILLLDETLTRNVVIAALLILGGIGLVLRNNKA